MVKYYVPHLSTVAAVEAANTFTHSKKAPEESGTASEFIQSISRTPVDGRTPARPVNSSQRIQNKKLSFAAFNHLSYPRPDNEATGRKAPRVNQAKCSESGRHKSFQVESRERLHLLDEL